MAVVGAGTQLINAIGIGSAILTTVGFIQGQIPEGAPAQGARVKIKAGLPELDAEADSLGGSINKIYAFDERNGYAGQVNGCKVESGGTCDVTVDQFVGSRRAGYISISNNNDATCIAWITVKQDDETKGGAWTGDIGYGCGQTWYNSVEPAGRLDEKDGGGEYVPKCTWIDGDHTNTIENSALKFDVGAYYEEAVEDTLSRGVQCESTIWGADNGPIAGRPGKRDFNPIHKRSRPTWMTDNLIMSNFTSQPAEQLCSSETSWGPDFIGPDGNFCDMENKEMTPLCIVSDVDGCIEVDEDAGHVIKRRTIARRSANVIHKSYGKIQKWGH